MSKPKRKYRSSMMASIHETAGGLHAAGLIDQQSMHEFDEACLTSVRPLTAELSSVIDCGTGWSEEDLHDFSENSFRTIEQLLEMADSERVKSDS